MNTNKRNNVKKTRDQYLSTAYFIIEKLTIGAELALGIRASGKDGNGSGDAEELHWMEERLIL